LGKIKLDHTNTLGNKHAAAHQHIGKQPSCIIPTHLKVIMLQHTNTLENKQAAAPNTSASP